MKIAGIQELTLIDYPKKLACTLFIYGCNFRCGFCHNPELVIKPLEKEFSEEEIMIFLEKRKQYLDGVCITGGEPLISLEEDFLKRIKDLGYSIKIDTNGSFPEKLKMLIEKKMVDFISMDIKSDKESYNEISKTNVDIKKIEESIKIISNSGLEYEFRTTVVPGYHNKEKMIKLAKWIKDIAGRPKKYVIQNFVARNTLVDEKFSRINGFKEEELEEMKNAVEDYFEEVKIR